MAPPSGVVFIKLLGVGGSFAPVSLEEGDTVWALLARAFDAYRSDWGCTAAKVAAFLVAKGGSTPSSNEIEGANAPLDISMTLSSVGIESGYWVVLRRVEDTGEGGNLPPPLSSLPPPPSDFSQLVAAIALISQRQQEEGKRQQEHFRVLSDSSASRTLLT